ncbi:MAG: hypothetical protein LM567_06535 [Desulfurococcaceae archaeon]|jgi:hypothetical protein|nr:hypothetical protein [Desulfurococcaceae archaeon]
MWEVIHEDVFDDVKTKHIVVILRDFKRTCNFLVFKKTFNVPEDIRIDQVTVDAGRSDVIKREVSIVFALDIETNDLKPVEEVKFGRTYSPHHYIRLR